MKVSELIELLKALPQDYTVVFDNNDFCGEVYSFIKYAFVNDKLKTIELREFEEEE